MSGRRRLVDLQAPKKTITPKEQRAPKMYSPGSVTKRKMPTEGRKPNEPARLTKQELVSIHTTLKETLQTRKKQLIAAKKEKKQLEAEIRQLEGKAPISESESYSD